MQDSDIINLYFDRNETAIKETDAKYGAYCNKIAFNILSDTHDAEECVNDTYMRTWNSIPPTRPSIFSAFLAKITRNLALDRYKGDATQKRSSNFVQSIDELCECISDNATIEHLELEELGELITNFLRSQKEHVKRMFVLRYFYEYSIEDIARIYNAGQSYVKVTLHRARAALAKYLKNQEVCI